MTKHNCRLVLSLLAELEICPSQVTIARVARRTGVKLKLRPAIVHVVLVVLGGFGALT